MNNRTENILALAVIIAVTTFAVAAMRKQSAKVTVSINQQATPVQQGVMTEKQKAHSKLYNGLGLGRKLREIPTGKKDSNGDLDVNIVRNPGMPFSTSDGTSLASGLEQAAKKADAVVVGVVKTKSSQLSEDENFIFTDYELTVEQVLKDNAVAHMQPEKSITVTAPGGKILLYGRIIQAIDKSLQPFEVGGRYLLFLRFLPATDAYTVSDVQGSVRLFNGKTKALTEGPLPPQLQSGKDAQSFINEVTGAIAASGTKAKEEQP